MAKNKQFEYRRLQAKKYAKEWARQNRQLSERGNYIYHMYDGSKTEGWWDDVAFKMGSQVIVVAWIHPRMEYQDKCEDLAYEAVAHLHPDKKEDLFAGATPNYRYLGKNKKRKKIVSYTLKNQSAEMHEWYNEWDKKKRELYSSSDIIVRPHIKIEQLNYTRFVSVCIPLEVIDQKSLEDMADFVKEAIKDRSLIEKTFPDYTYTKENWVEDKIKYGWDDSRF